MVDPTTLTDAHAHLSAEDPQAELAFRAAHEIATCFSCGAPEEWNRVAAALELAARPDLFCASFGIHPWEADRFEPAAHRRLFTQAAAVGEIGMDSVWCQVPLRRQAAVFEEQLQMAADLRKPVVLHTKGEEEAVFARVRDFPQPVLVHWYSGPLDTFERFAELGCFFTLGPDCTGGSALNQAMLAALPLDRILMETDGLEGILWAEGERTGDARSCEGGGTFDLICETLARSMAALAYQRDLPLETVASRVRQNARNFYHPQG